MLKSTSLSKRVPVSAKETGVTAETVKKIARLSRLHVEEDRLAHLADEMNGILAWIEQLNFLIRSENSIQRFFQTINRKFNN